ncbi:hypothetical protein LguiA_007289 [Lonicera macranthoides]
MTELRLLEIHNACIPKGPDYLPNELWWIDWDKYPSNALPAMFEADVLVGLRLHCNGTAVTELPPSIGYLKNLKKLSLCKSSSQSPTSIFQSLFQLRKRQKTTRSLVLAPIWGLTSLTLLDLTDCNLSEGAIPSDLGSLFSLENLCLGGNNFENLPSLNQLSQLAHLELHRCKMLRELPELPSGLNRLFTNYSASLSLYADRCGMCKIEYGWFQDRRKLLNSGESEIVASTLSQQNLQRRNLWPYTPIALYMQKSHLWPYTPIGENVILPGIVIPEWFCNHIFTGDSVLLKLPRISTGRVVVPKWYSFVVILEVINEVKSFNLSEVAEIDHSRYLSSLEVELSFTKPCDDHSINAIHRKAIFLTDTGNINCLEHTIMPGGVFVPCRKSHWFGLGETKVQNNGSRKVQGSYFMSPPSGEWLRDLFSK